jgi:hypothetical protein
MPTKIETHLSPEALHEFFKRCAQTKGGGTLKTIQAIAEEFGVRISLMSASAVRDGPFAAYLDELKGKREMAEAVSAVAKEGLSLSDAAASILSQRLFDRLLAADELSDKETGQLSLALSRLRTGDQRSKYLEAKLEEMGRKLQLQQFDAAKAAIAHAKEIRAVMADKTLDEGQRTERVRAVLFGTQPADFRPVETKGAQPEVTPEPGA